MAPQLLDIEPQELKFVFELKKQSLCAVHLTNNSDSYVAFKVKTTSPKRYCVRPNTGVILPRSKCDFIVTMQAQKVAPPDMQLKDKFLIQSTVVPYGTKDDDISPTFFSKESGRYIEENKLRVVLVSPPQSPAIQPINGAMDQESTYYAPVFEQRHNPDDQVPRNVENAHPPQNVFKEVEELKTRVRNLETKLAESETVFKHVEEEKSAIVQERDKLHQEVVLLRRRSASKVQVGFPGLFVVFVMLVSMVLGFWLNS